MCVIKILYKLLFSQPLVGWTKKSVSYLSVKNSIIVVKVKSNLAQSVTSDLSLVEVFANNT